MAFELTDDGTMDTVVRCAECGEEARFNFDPAGPSDEVDMTAAYEDFIEWALENADEDHECATETA